MRWSRALLPALLIVLLAACGGSSASTGGNGDSSQAAQASSDTQASEPATESTAPEASSDSGNGSAGDLDSLVNALTPPNSTEVQKTTAQGGVYVAWNSTDSTDSLKSFYESAIPGTGMQILTTTSASGTFSWIFAENDTSSYGGSITLAPATDGTSGSYVVLAAATG
jgi:hypothetical protein